MRWPDLQMNNIIGPALKIGNRVGYAQLLYSKGKAAEERNLLRRSRFSSWHEAALRNALTLLTALGDIIAAV